MDWIIPTSWALVLLGLAASVVDLLVGSAGLLVAAGVVLMVVGIAVGFSHSAMFGITVLATTTIVTPVVGWILARVFPWTPLGRSVLAKSSSVEETASSFRSLRDLEVLEGRLGTARSFLRPSGVVEFDGRRIDCITEGMMVEPGQTVRCLKVSGARVLVRPVEPGEEIPLTEIRPELFEMDAPAFTDRKTTYGDA